MHEGLAVALACFAFIAGVIIGEITMIRQLPREASVSSSVSFIERRVVEKLTEPALPNQYAPINPTPRADGWIVCAPSLPVYDGPGSFYHVIGELQAGDAVQVETWGKGAGAGWAMLGMVQWVDGSGLCR